MGRIAGIKLRVLLVTMAIAIAGLVTWTFSGQRAVTSTTLADGRRLSLRAVTFDTEHRFSDRLAQRIVAPLLPQKLAARFRLTPLTVSTSNKSLVCWIELAGSGAGTAIEVAVADDEGNGVISGKSSSAARAFGRNHVIAGHQFTVFPRRPRELTVHVSILNPDGKEQLADFRIRNPAYASYPEWQTRTLPIRHQGRDAEFIVTQFHTGLYSTNDPPGSLVKWTELVVVPDPPVGLWRPAFVKITDATGNVYERRERPTPIGADKPAQMPLRQPRTQITFPCMLWPDEGWKVELRLVQTQPSIFLPRHRWDATNVCVPSSDKITQLEIPSAIGGGKLLVKGPGLPNTAAMLSFGVAKTPASTGSIVIEALTEADSTVTFLKVTDNRGSKMVVFPNFSHRFTLRNVPPETRTLDMSLAIHRAETIEFVAKPSLLRTNIERERF